MVKPYYKKINAYSFALCSTLLLASCGGGGGGNSSNTAVDDTQTLNKHYFVGNTRANGSELWTSDGTESGTHLVKDFNLKGSSFPADFTEVGSTTYFSAKDALTGRELWKSDANGVSLVKDINQLTQTGSNPEDLLALNGKLYFTAEETSVLTPSSRSLWVSDGTPEGTQRIGDFVDPQYLTAMPDNSLYFVSNNQLWNYDGTNVPAQPVSVTAPLLSVDTLTVVGSRVFFIGHTLEEGYELWLSDGTDAGTRIAADLAAGPRSFFETTVVPMHSINNKLLFVRNTLTDGSVIYISDGTQAGTVPLMSSDPTPVPLEISHPRGIGKGANELIYFTNKATSTLFRTNGTVAGTFEISSRTFNSVSQTKILNNQTMISAGGSLLSSDGTPGGTRVILSRGVNFVTSQNAVYFLQAFSLGPNTENVELFRTDGTNPAVSVATLGNFPSRTLAGSISLYSGSNEIYLSLTNEAGNEPWISDGTQAGTRMLADINTQPSESAYLSAPVVLNHELYFIDKNGLALWTTDGTESGTVALTPDTLTSISQLTASANHLYFIAADDTHGLELWSSDGTVEGTQVLDQNSGVASSSLNILKDVKGVQYFSNNSNDELFTTTGSIESIQSIGIISGRHSNMYTVGNKAYFIAQQNVENTDLELWVSDGTPEGTHLLKDINPMGSSVDQRNIKTASIGNTLYFTADDGNGLEVWKTDGTEANTQVLINLNATDDGMSSTASQLFALKNTLYFSGISATGNIELWSSDGTEKGTIQLTDFDGAGSQIDSNGLDYTQSFALSNGKVFFTVGLGDKLWVSDGTLAGTNEIKANISIRTFSNGLRNSAKIGDYLYFAANEDDGLSTGVELWRSNGTLSGTTLVKDIYTDADSKPNGFHVVKNTLYFTADDGEHGRELWKSNGTDAGTVLVKDVNPGSGEGASCYVTAACNTFEALYEGNF